VPKIPRMNLHLRLQHGVLLLTVLAALVTGQGIAFAFLPAGTRFGLWYRAHFWCGLGAAVVVWYHILYLLVRGYVEGILWTSFPLAWRSGDWREVREQAAYLWSGGKQPRSGHYRASQKALYWTTAVLVIGLASTGSLIGFWEHFGGHLSLSNLGFLAHLHRGLGLILLAVFLWHLYGTLAWKGAWNPQWTWLTGNITEELAGEKVPGFLEEHRQLQERRRESIGRPNTEEKEEEETRLDRRTVEEDLEEGNQLAREEKFVDALFYYQRALERYPGYSQARYNMAVVLRKMGERAMATESFRQFLRDDPFHPLARKAQEFIAELKREESE
jgi:cytochrome b subunit of formate dehydrogenase